MGEFVCPRGATVDNRHKIGENLFDQQTRKQPSHSQPAPGGSFHVIPHLSEPNAKKSAVKSTQINMVQFLGMDSFWEVRKYRSKTIETVSREVIRGGNCRKILLLVDFAGHSGRRDFMWKFSYPPGTGNWYTLKSFKCDICWEIYCISVRLGMTRLSRKCFDWRNRGTNKIENLIICGSGYTKYIHLNETTFMS